MWLEPGEPLQRGSAPRDDALAGPRGETASPEKVIEELYRRECAALRQYISRIVRNRRDGEDIVHDAFMRTLRALFAGTVRSPRAVLYRTARNLALNHLRDARVRNSDSARITLSEVYDRAPMSVEDEHIAGEDVVVCRRLLDRLPSRCREALLLRVVDELSYAEMAGRMHLSISTIEKHVARGKKIFRSQLTFCRPDEDATTTTCVDS